MARRAKITGYLELDDSQLDLDDSSGLAQGAYEDVAHNVYGGSPKISTLDDLEIVLEKENDCE